MSPAKIDARSYVRDGVPALTMEEQEAILAGAGIDLVRCFRDRLKKSQIKRRNPDDLADLNRLLRPTTRQTPSLIYVASLRCLGWGIADITRALAAAARSQASIHACDIGETFDAATIPEKLMTALANADEATKRGMRNAGRNAGVVAAALKRNKKRDKILAIVRPLWLLPPGEVSAAEIAAKVGVSVRSLHLWLGPREDARKAITEGKKHR